jgi:hypothetical protein
VEWFQDYYCGMYGVGVIIGRGNPRILKEEI